MTPVSILHNLYYIRYQTYQKVCCYFSTGRICRKSPANITIFPPKGFWFSINSRNDLSILSKSILDIIATSSKYYTCCFGVCITSSRINTSAFCSNLEFAELFKIPQKSSGAISGLISNNQNIYDKIRRETLILCIVYESSSRLARVGLRHLKVNKNYEKTISKKCTREGRTQHEILFVSSVAIIIESFQ